MKLTVPDMHYARYLPFSALGRAVWDETQRPDLHARFFEAAFSALGRAVWDETQVSERTVRRDLPFSALGRAVWDETLKKVKNW